MDRRGDCRVAGWPHLGVAAALAASSVVGGGSCRRSESDAPPAPRTARPSPAPASAATAPSPTSAATLQGATDRAIVHWYRAEAEIQDGLQVPFFLGLAKTGSFAQIKNGEERLDVVILQRDPLKVRIPVLGAILDLGGSVGPGVLAGTWSIPVYGKTFPLRATRIPEASPRTRFDGDEPPAVNIDGQWSVAFPDLGQGRGVFRQSSDGLLTGSLVPPDVGDLRHLSGRVIGNQFFLSTFDGGHAYLVTGTVADDGSSLEGTWHFGGLASWTFSAKRGDQPSMASLVQVRLKAGARTITVPELESPEFKGQPVIVDYFGTWCPACLDLTPAISKLHERYADRGLKILSIALEPQRDVEGTDRRIDEFRARFQVNWDITVRHTDEYMAQLPPEIENVDGFPLTIFVRRDGTVAGVHTAFISDAARPEHLEVLKRFDDWALEIVSSPAPGEPAKAPGADDAGAQSTP